MDHFYYWTILELAERLRTREISPVEVTERLLERCQALNDRTHVYITVTAEVALKQARQAEKEILAGRYRGPLHGIPISLKDNIATKGILTTCASVASENWVPDHDAAVYTRLKRAGAILVGKANLQEYAISLSPAFPEPINPWHPGRSASGSSSGSGVGVALGMAYGSIGTDTGGSGRQPASVNGVVGLKPTSGRVSRFGVFPLSFTLDHVTTMTRTAADSAVMLQATSGYDRRDDASARARLPDFRARTSLDLSTIRFGRARGYTHEGFDPDVVETIDAALDVLSGMGARIDDVELPLVRQCLELFDTITNPEVAMIHADNLAHSADKLGPTLIDVLNQGKRVPATEYVQALQTRARMREEFEQVFKQYDVLLGPTSPMRTGEPGVWYTTVNGKTVDRRVPGREHTGIYNISGLPAIVVPAGFSSEGTPIGLQIAGKWFDEATIIAVAEAFQQATDWHTRRPPEPRP